mmetsp:Transcript_16709/g.65273  ORF Transcript_16709/g.65273 Transcript_16709/m.65273 type:complete len:689 (-) Transcript_16709:36-2102(-)
MRCSVLLVVALLAAAAVAQTSSIGLQICGSSTETFTFSTSSPVTIDIVTDDADVTVSPTSLAFSSTVSSGTFTVTCGAITDVEIQFLNGGSVVASSRTLCKGLITVTNPITEIIRGNDFVLDVQLTPTPVEVAQLIISEDNPIIILGTDRMTFAVGQSNAEAKFFVPKAEVGPVNIQFRSVSLFDYGGANCQDVIFPINVLGTISTSLEGATIGDGVSVEVQVFISPPAAGTVVVDIDENDFGTATPTQLVFQNGEFVKTFRYYPITTTSPETQTITFTSPFYATLDEDFTVIGSIFTDIPPVVSTFAVEDLTIALLPGVVTQSVTITTESSDNVNVPSSITISAGFSLAHYQLTATAEGDAFVRFSAPGYTDFVENFIVSDVECPEGTTTNIDGDLCVTCPASNGDPCSNSGTCTFSTDRFNAARCECFDGCRGSECQFCDGLEECSSFTSSGGLFSFGNIPDVSAFQVNVPAGLIDDGNVVDGGNGTICVEGYFPEAPFGNAVDPSATAPTVSNKVVTALDTGFDIDVAVFDNTPAGTLEGPLALHINYNAKLITQNEFEQSVLYYWNTASQQWMAASQTCPTSTRQQSTDLQALTITVNVCVTGQYHLFEISPIPAHEAPVDQPETLHQPVQQEGGDDNNNGLNGGQQAPVPPQPQFVDRSSSSDAGMLSASLRFTVCLVVISMF